MRLLASLGRTTSRIMMLISREQLIEELKKFVASLEHARVTAENYDDPRAMQKLEQMLKEARELLKRAERLDD